MQEDKEHIYIKHLKGELTDSEREAIEATGEIKILNKILATTEEWKLPAVKDSFADFKNKKIQKKKNNGWLRIAAGIALIIGLSTFSYLRFLNITTISTSAGESLSVTLPDGCEVLLNGNSSISYNNWNWSNNREIEMNGQAYFDISVKGPLHVSFSGGTVDVVGTEFDILSHNNTNIVKCFEGIVDVKFTDKTYRLTHNMGIRNHESGNEIEFNFEGEKATWRDEYTQFNSAPLTEVISALSLQYDLTFETGKLPIETMEFTGRYTNNEALRALQMVFEPMGISYSLNGDKVILK